MKKNSFIVGFTLVELMVTVAIASVLLAIAAPNFLSLSSSNSAKNAANRLLDSLAYARSEAVTRSVNVTVCSKAIGSNTCAGANVWVGGWLIYIEGAGTLDLDAEGAGNGDDLLLRVEDLSSLNLNANAIADGNTLIYDAVGEANTAMQISFMGEDGNAAEGRNISISVQGTASIDEGAVI
jgi:type IV fimbrial biogenesis protein FimT